jgi:hypothetical protein
LFEYVMSAVISHSIVAFVCAMLNGMSIDGQHFIPDRQSYLTSVFLFIVCRSRYLYLCMCSLLYVCNGFVINWFGIHIVFGEFKLDNSMCMVRSFLFGICVVFGFDTS